MTTESMISIEIRLDTLGSWWAHIVQRPVDDADSKVRSIGRKFKTNQEAWQWAMRKISSIKGREI